MRRESNGKSNMVCPSATPSSLIGLPRHKEFAFESLAQCVWPWISAPLNSLGFHCEPPLFYAFVQYCWPTATNTHVKHTNTHTYTFLLSSHTTLGGPLHQDRTDKTVVKTSLKPCSCSITEGSEMLIVLCVWTCFHTVSHHDFVYCPSAAFTDGKLVIYCQQFISAVTQAILSNCTQGNVWFSCQWCTLLIPRRPSSQTCIVRMWNDKKWCCT